MFHSFVLDDRFLPQSITGGIKWYRSHEKRASMYFSLLVFTNLAVWLVGGCYNLKPLAKTYHDSYLHLTKYVQRNLKLSFPFVPLSLWRTRYSEDVAICSPVNCAKQLAKNFKSSGDTVLSICVAEFDSPIFEDEAEEYFLVRNLSVKHTSSFEFHIRGMLVFLLSLNIGDKKTDR